MLSSLSLRHHLSDLLERGRLPAPVALPLSRAWDSVSARRVARPLRLPPVPVVGVGGAVLGGAGKTPVAIATAQALSRAGARVALVAHAYRARPLHARQVLVDDPVALVGDDALVAARALSSWAIPTWVAPTRQSAIDAAARDCSVIVVDGLLQSTPEPLSCSLLVLDALLPWGAGACPPAGDLRAPPWALLRATDRVVLVSDANCQGETALPPFVMDACRVELRIVGARAGAVLFPVDQLRSLRLGVLLLVGRPQRILDSLERCGVRCETAWFGGDHQPPGGLALAAIRRAARISRIDAWLVTPKCGTHLSGLDLGAPAWEIETSLRLDPRTETVVDSRPCVRRLCSSPCSRLPCCPFPS
ncbi:MAG TPA: tetraacyldisaccharide 4'-kinase [Polyangiaceae bacterium]|nr:tetraacyldisaccharide 4'-kinase [Polyangiaceae bacterium]